MCGRDQRYISARCKLDKVSAAVKTGTLEISFSSSVLDYIFQICDSNLGWIIKMPTEPSHNHSNWIQEQRNSRALKYREDFVFCHHNIRSMEMPTLNLLLLLFENCPCIKDLPCTFILSGNKECDKNKIRIATKPGKSCTWPSGENVSFCEVRERFSVNNHIWKISVCVLIRTILASSWDWALLQL